MPSIESRSDLVLRELGLCSLKKAIVRVAQLPAAQLAAHDKAPFDCSCAVGNTRTLSTHFEPLFRGLVSVLSVGY